MEKSPIFLEQEKAQELCDICGEILRNARNELYLNLRFMDTALSALLFSPDTQRRGVATDGFCLRFQPDDLVLLYRRGRVYVNRIYLHRNGYIVDAVNTLPVPYNIHIPFYGKKPD